MSQRHPIQNDCTMLVTIVTHQRRPIFADPVNAREAVECLYRVQGLHPFFLFGFVIMPDHSHFLLYVPSPQTISGMMRSYKSGLIFDLHLKQVWQPRFHIRVIDDKHSALQYIHGNPIRKGLAEIPEDYPWSSASGKWDVAPLDVF